MIGAGIAGGYFVLSGQYQSVVMGDEKAESLLGSNGFGYLMLLTTICLAYLWTIYKKKLYIKTFFLVPFFMLSSFFTLLSGSRKAMLSLTLFYILWLWFCHRKVLLRKPLVLLAVLFIFIFGGIKAIGIVKESEAGDRFARAWLELTEGTVTTRGGLSNRVFLYKKGFSSVAKSPVLGIGLAHFQYQDDVGIMAHSDFLAVAIGSGVPGLLLYSSIFVILWLRTGFLIKNSPNYEDVVISK